MKITAVSADCYSVPVKLPLLDEPSVQTIVIARVDTDREPVGYGLAGAPGMAIATREFINRQLAPALVGMDPRRHEKVWSFLLERFNRRALGGVWSMGVSAIDLALWDLKGKQHPSRSTRARSIRRPRRCSSIRLSSMTATATS